MLERVESIVQTQGQGMQINYSPTLQFYGDSLSKKDAEELMETEQEKFERHMRQFIKDNGRLAFR